MKNPERKKEWDVLLTPFKGRAELRV